MSKWQFSIVFSVLISFAIFSTNLCIAQEKDPFSLDMKPDESSLKNADNAFRDTKASSSPITAAPQSMNPDISFVADFLAANPQAHSVKGGGLHRGVDLREVEIDGVGYLSPFATATAVISANSDEAAAEEVYLDFITLPYSLKLKLGKILVDTDTLNPLHQHVLPFADRPLALHHAFGAEGFKTVGGNVSALVPNPFNHFIMLSATAGASLNDTEQYTAFYGGNLKSPIYSLKASTTFDFTSSTYLNVSASDTVAPLPDSSRTVVYIGEALLRMAPDPAGFNFTFLNGILWNRGNPNQTVAFTTRGFYTYFGFQFTKNWKMGTRLDYTDNQTFDGIEKQYVGILSYFITENNYFRLQYARHNLPQTAYFPNVWENRVWFQVDFALGPHKPHTSI